MYVHASPTALQRVTLGLFTTFTVVDAHDATWVCMTQPTTDYAGPGSFVVGWTAATPPPVDTSLQIQDWLVMRRLHSPLAMQLRAWLPTTSAPIHGITALWRRQVGSTIPLDPGFAQRTLHALGFRLSIDPSFQLYHPRERAPWPTCTTSWV